MSGELAGFYAARLDEDERVAKGLVGATRFIGREPDFYGVGGPAAVAFWGHFDPVRMLAEVAAKRAILAEYERIAGSLARYPNAANADALIVARAMVGHLASTCSGHPDYRQEWAP